MTQRRLKQPDTYTYTEFHAICITVLARSRSQTNQWPASAVNSVLIKRAPHV